MSMEKSRVTMKDIAKKLYVSQNTVSLALRNIPTVKKETRELILRTAEEMGYVYATHSTETDDKSIHTGNICVFTNSRYFSNFYFYTELKAMMKSRLQERGYGLIVETMFGTDMSEEQLRIFCDMNNVAGIIFMGDMGEEYVCLALKMNMPVVTSSFYCLKPFTDCVLEDNINAIVDAVERVLARGYEKIGYLGSISMGVAQNERHLGFLNAVRKFELVVPDGWINIHCPQDTDLLYNCFHKYFKSEEEKPEVFICGCDQIAFCAMEAAQDVGLSIPEDIGLVGFDHNELSMSSTPRLTTIDTNNGEHAELLADLIDSRIKGDKLPLRRQIVSTTWVEGGTISPLRKNGE